MIVLDLSILNQKGTPMFNSDIFANRPAFGIVGRIFISTDTKEFFRDTGTSWELIGGPGSGTITGSGTTGTLAKFTGTSSIGDSIVSETGSALTINGTAKATNWYVGTPSDLTRSFSAIGNANNVALWLEEYGNVTASADVFMYKGRGTSASPINILVGDSAGAISTGGYVNVTLFSSTNWFAEVVNVDTINNHADSDWKLTQSYNSVGTTENFRIRASDGFVVAPNGGFETTGNINLFAGANTRRFVFDANAGIPRIFSFRTGNLPRWAFRVDGVESGSDTGADFAIRRYNDAGVFIDSPLFIVRSTGQTFVGTQTTASGKLVVNSATADNHLQIVGANAPSIRIDNAGSGGTQRFVFGLATATNNFIQGATAGEFCISTQSAGAMLFGMWQTINASEVMRITTANNLVVGSIVDNGNRLQITGNANSTGYFEMSSIIISNTNGVVGSVNSTAANGGYLIWKTSGTSIADMGTSQQIFGTGGNDTFGINGRGARALVFGTNNTERFRIASTGAATFTSSVDIGNSVAAAVAAPSTHKVAILIGGVQYYLLASNV